MTKENKWGVVKATAPPHKEEPCASSIGSMGINETFIQYFNQFFPNVEVVKGLNNRVGLNKPPFILIQFFIGKRISTDEVRYTSDAKFVKQFSKNLMRIDFYGNKKYPAADLATRFRTIWNNDSSFEFFARYKKPVFPLYCDDIALKSFVNSEDQYSDRVTCDAYYEYHPEVRLPQESATEIIFPVALSNNK